MKKLLLFIILFSFSATAQIRVVDGDSLEINNKKIRLIGIDAPEYYQTCFDEDGLEYDCGFDALEYLQNLIEKGQNRGDKVKCKKISVDKYNRDLSECFIGKTNINRAMVKSGYALSYWSDEYKKLENKAKKNKRGIFRGKYMRPELYRILEKYKKDSKNI